MSELPRMALIEQTFPRPRIEDCAASVEKGLRNLRSLSALDDCTVAVAVGSRGIANLEEIVRATLRELERRGARPFLVPAMGSHGGATAEGQRELLRSYGIEKESLGVSVRSTTETVEVARTPEGIPVRVDREAWRADGILLINRVKPHTDFEGNLGSGLLKMLAVGLANPDGAGDFHARVGEVGYERLIESKARPLLKKVFCGVAIVENAHHETAKIEVVEGQKIPEAERRLFQRAREWMPSLPFDEADLLIVDRIGKDISGTGMDPNITGRWFRVNSIWQAEKPKITRILVRSLSAGTHGNGLGIGLADFCTTRAVEALDRQVTYANAVTSRNTVIANLPLVYPNDREAISAAVESLGAHRRISGLRIARVQSTLQLSRLQLSETLLEALSNREECCLVGPLKTWSFDRSGNLEDETNYEG